MDFQTRSFEIFYKLKELNVRNMIYMWVQETEDNTFENFLSTILCPHCRNYLNLPGLPLCTCILQDRE